jgi:hypothetical protein
LWNNFFEGLLRLDSDVSTCSLLFGFKRNGIELQVRREFDSSFQQIFTHVTGHWRWCLYMFPFSAAAIMCSDCTLRTDSKTITVGDEQENRLKAE